MRVGLLHYICSPSETLSDNQPLTVLPASDNVYTSFHAHNSFLNDIIDAILFKNSITIFQQCLCAPAP